MLVYVLVRGKRVLDMAYGENGGMGCGMASIARGHERKNYIEREINHIKVLFPDEKMSELYDRCTKERINHVAEQCMFSREALAIVINGYENSMILANKKEGKKKKVKVQQERIFSNSDIITDVKQNKNTNNIIIFYADGRFEKIARTGKNYRLVKEQIMEFGKHIVFTVEENILSSQDKKRINLISEEHRSDALIRKIKNEKKLLMEERQLYMKWKFFFEHQDMIEEMEQYETSEDLKMLLRGRNLSFQKLNSKDYNYQKAVEDYDIAVKMYERIQENEEELIKSLSHIK